MGLYSRDEENLIADVMNESGATRAVVIQELMALRMLVPKPPPPRPPFSPRISHNSQRTGAPRPSSARGAPPQVQSPRGSFMAPRPGSARAPASPRTAKPAAAKRPQSARLPNLYDDVKWQTSYELQYPNYAKYPQYKHIYQPKGLSEEELAELTAMKKDLYEREHKAHLKMTPDELAADLMARTHVSDIFHRKPLPKWMAGNVNDIVRPVDKSRYASNSKRQGDNRPAWKYC